MQSWMCAQGLQGNQEILYPLEALEQLIAPWVASKAGNHALCQPVPPRRSFRREFLRNTPEKLAQQDEGRWQLPDQG